MHLGNGYICFHICYIYLVSLLIVMIKNSVNCVSVEVCPDPS